MIVLTLPFKGYPQKVRIPGFTGGFDLKGLLFILLFLICRFGGRKIAGRV